MQVRIFFKGLPSILSIIFHMAGRTDWWKPNQTSLPPPSGWSYPSGEEKNDRPTGVYLLGEIETFKSAFFEEKSLFNLKKVHFSPDICFPIVTIYALVVSHSCAPRTQAKVWHLVLKHLIKKCPYHQPTQPSLEHLRKTSVNDRDAKLTSLRAGGEERRPQRAQGLCWLASPGQPAQPWRAQSELHATCASWPMTQT